MNKQESNQELKIIKREEQEILELFDNTYDRKKRSIKEINFDTLESWVFRTIERTKCLKGIRNRFVGLTIKSNLQSVYLKRSEEHTSELQSRFDLVCRLLLEKKN